MNWSIKVASGVLVIALISSSTLLAQEKHQGLWEIPSGSHQRAGSHQHAGTPQHSVVTPVPVQNVEPASYQVGQPVFDVPPANHGGHVGNGGCPGCANCGGGNGQTKYFCGVDGSGPRPLVREALWQDQQMIPWEAFAYGEYIGPHRTPHVPQYRLRVDDQIEVVYQATREQTFQPYRLTVGDSIRISSSADEELNHGTEEFGLRILSDGSLSLRLIGRVIAARKTIQDLQDELNERYAEYFETDPAIVVSGVETDTRLQDLINAVDARFGSGGQSRLATVSPDGTVQLPMIGSVPTIGLTLEELGREINMRYRQRIQGIEVTPVLTERAPRSIFVLGEVAEPGQVDLTGPTTAMQSLALAGGWNVGGNIRQIVVFRRDQNWRLMALKLDLAGGLHGHRPLPSDEIWLRHGDIVLVPKTPILRIADAVELYFTRTLYSVFPAELGVFDGQADFN